VREEESVFMVIRVTGRRVEGEQSEIQALAEWTDCSSHSFARVSLREGVRKAAWRKVSTARESLGSCNRLHNGMVNEITEKVSWFRDQYFHGSKSLGRKTVRVAGDSACISYDW